MKKKIGIICIAVAMIFASSLTIAYAVGGLTLFSTPDSNDVDVELVYNIVNTEDDLSIAKKTEIVDSANKYSAILSAFSALPNDVSSLSAISSTQIQSNTEIFSQYDNTVNESFYEIREKNYTISIAEDSSLRSFTDNTFDYNLASDATKETAEAFALEVYDSLDFKSNHELADLNKFGDNLWEAVFATKIDGVFNYYDSVKVYFCPIQKKIAALRVHSSEYQESILSTRSVSLSMQGAKQAVIDNFSDITLDDITDVEIEFTKPNNFFTRADGTELVSTNEVVKTWKVTVKKDYTYFVFIDAETGDVIGGDRIK